MSASKEPEQVKRFAKRLTKEKWRLARITQEIIELSRLQATDALTKADLVDIDHVVARAIDRTASLRKPAVCTSSPAAMRVPRWRRARRAARDRAAQSGGQRDPVLTGWLAGGCRRQPE